MPRFSSLSKASLSYSSFKSYIFCGVTTRVLVYLSSLISLPASSRSPLESLCTSTVKIALILGDSMSFNTFCISGLSAMVSPDTTSLYLFSSGIFAPRFLSAHSFRIASCFDSTSSTVSRGSSDLDLRR